MNQCVTGSVPIPMSCKARLCSLIPGEITQMLFGDGDSASESSDNDLYLMYMFFDVLL